jgi:hypothetical protein
MREKKKWKEEEEVGRRKNWKEEEEISVIIQCNMV